MGARSIPERDDLIIPGYTPEQCAGISIWLPWLVATAFFMQMLDGTILNTALPSIARDLGESPLRIQGVIISYMLTVAIFIPVSGWLTDRFGPRPVFGSSIALFTLGSVLCAMSPNLVCMVAARVVQGVGGALMVPVGRLVVLRLYPSEKLVQVLSFVVMPGIAGSMFGPTAGGLIVQYASWHWIFLINVPIGIAGVLLTRKYMPTLPPVSVSPFDKVGFVFFALSLLLVTLALQGISDLGFSALTFGVLNAIGLACQAVYWRYCSLGKNAIFNRRPFEKKRFSIGLAANVFTRIGTGAIPFMLPLFMQLVLGYSPLKAGVIMVPMACASVLGKSQVNALLHRFGYRNMLIFNTIMQGLLITGFYGLSADPSYVTFITHLVLLGGINSMQFTLLNTYTLIDLNEEDKASGNALLSVVVQISQSLAVGIATYALNQLMPSGHDTAASVLAFRETFLILGICSVGSSVIFYFSPKEAPAQKQ